MMNINDHGVFPMLPDNNINLLTLIKSIEHGMDNIIIRRLDTKISEVWRTLVSVVPNIQAVVMDNDSMLIKLTPHDVNAPPVGPIDFKYLNDTMVSVMYDTQPVTTQAIAHAVIIYDANNVINILQGLLRSYPDLNRPQIFLPNWEEGQSLALLDKVLGRTVKAGNVAKMFNVNMMPFIQRWKALTPIGACMPLGTGIDLILPNAAPYHIWTTNTPATNPPCHELINTATVEGQELTFWMHEAFSEQEG